MKSLELKNKIQENNEKERVERIKQEMNELKNKVGKIVNCQRCKNEFKVEFSWFTSYCKSCQEKNSEEAEKRREIEENGFWITTPNYNSMNWGSKTVKIEWNDEDGDLITDKFEMNDKVVKLNENWFKMVKLPINDLPNWLVNKERERETN